jgi:hypothetical protein
MHIQVTKSEGEYHLNFTWDDRDAIEDAYRDGEEKLISVISVPERDAALKAFSAIAWLDVETNKDMPLEKVLQQVFEAGVAEGRSQHG